MLVCVRFEKGSWDLFKPFRNLLDKIFWIVNVRFNELCNGVKFLTLLDIPYRTQLNTTDQRVLTNVVFMAFYHDFGKYSILIGYLEI